MPVQAADAAMRWLRQAWVILRTYSHLHSRLDGITCTLMILLLHYKTRSILFEHRLRKSVITNAMCVL